MPMTMPWSTTTAGTFHALTAMLAPRRGREASSPAREHSDDGLLHGVAAQDCLVALFEGGDDFESPARNTTQSVNAAQPTIHS